MSSAKLKHELWRFTRCQACTSRRQSRPNSDPLQQNIQQEAKDEGHVHEDFPFVHAWSTHDLHSIEHASPALLSSQGRPGQKDVEHRPHAHSQGRLHERVHRVDAQNPKHAHSLLSSLQTAEWYQHEIKASSQHE